jgi:hypothetical protein
MDHGANVDVTLYSATVPVLEHYLRQLGATLERAEGHARDSGLPLLTSTLAPGMFGYAQQVTIACGFAVRALCPLLGMAQPELAGGAQSWAALRERLAATLAFLAQVPRSTVDAAGALRISTVAGHAAREWSGRDFALQYALPNFFFHASMAHAILRNQGVAVGKGDFDGFHSYPAGFSFPDAPTEHV